MKQEKSTIHQIEKIGAISGIVSVFFYFGAAVLPLPLTLGQLIGFAFPLLWIISYMGLYHFLKKTHHTPTLEIAYIFGIIGGALACTLIVVQQANIMWNQEALALAPSEDTKALLKATFKGANRVQAGLDVAFDIFITISLFFFGLNIAKSPKFPAFLGYICSLIAATLLILNMITFPNSPASSGLFDVGPFMGIWMLVIYIWFTVVLFKKKNSL
ncbi:DUF4386 family protein [Lentimicrobium sp. L6]|uniref:DUF4386 family protein n=1 Tax=Lentimicrobium sp. L6 TaxID=2735916 RepID=UPI001554C1FD|nr:DUF4386 family protein [Lentimicrobium sp. L6]NPD85472.1 DUF4386 family protein [Lentimicrobium sp. L6]